VPFAHKTVREYLARASESTVGELVRGMPPFLHATYYELRDLPASPEPHELLGITLMYAGHYFPRPWTRLPLAVRARFRGLWAAGPAITVTPATVFQQPEDLVAAVQGAYILRVDSPRWVQDVLGQVKCWLGHRGRRHVHMPGGGRPIFEKLKWLAALRLHKLGFRSPDIRAILNLYAYPDDFDFRIEAKERGLLDVIPPLRELPDVGPSRRLKRYHHDTKVCYDVRRAAQELRAFERALLVTT
jgi:hypothetical protein